MFIQNTFSDSSLTVLLVSLLVFYPIFGSIVWIVGAIKYRSMIKTNTPVIPEGMVLPKVSILVAAHNEELQIDNTIRRMLYDLNYPNYDLIIASDGSTDRTNEIVLEWTKKDPRVRLVEIQENMGKAHAITQAAFYSDAEFFLGIDADSFIIGDGLKDMMAYMLVDTDFSPANRVGAVLVHQRR
ncbi:glycosyltransferase [Weissella confusa]|uniref:glycosyltransferase n=1 Tax=Weissella confusa TaxID=1583 RepID=UPI0018F25753|nr:glycosyltransferase family 2 protein [Weissella confusa]MBJ7650264.1 glycosyltransferase [Weissella confusa]MBJ7662355.1 glycosyltransferase [Weissella confusa]